VGLCAGFERLGGLRGLFHLDQQPRNFANEFAVAITWMAPPTPRRTVSDMTITVSYLEFTHAPAPSSAHLHSERITPERLPIDEYLILYTNWQLDPQRTWLHTESLAKPRRV